jgi:hypothetical protein
VATTSDSLGREAFGPHRLDRGWNTLLWADSTPAEVDGQRYGGVLADPWPLLGRGALGIYGDGRAETVAVLS